MVMEAPPSPNSVGREFVRQYYTLLNKAPEHLHRFYNNQSSFVHGGLDPLNRETSPMIGQKQIHQKIQQLNFRDCHAKIEQVDAQATLGNGVVVQVTGELSNAGQPMRRFTQTFVLAAQSPKKYYVHNDIFRYQDVIISDEECEPEVRSDVEDDMNQERPTLGDLPPITQQPMTYYTPNAAPIPANMAPVPHHLAQPPPHVLPQQPLPTPVPTVNGAIHPDDLNVMPPAQIPQHVNTTSAPVMGPPISGLQPTMPQSPMPVPIPVEERSPQPQPIDEGAGDGPMDSDYTEEPIPEFDSQEIIQEPAVSNEPKTYATLLKSGSNVGYAAATHITSLPPQPPASVSPPPMQNRYDNRDVQPGLQTNQAPMPGQRNNINRNNNIRGNQRIPRQDSRGGQGRTSINEDGNSFDERRRSQGNSFSDMNQLFLGNLPHTATEDELRDIFIQFGTILDLRIHSKPGNKAGPLGARVPPNYGFITYETPQGVQSCLAAKPIFFPNVGDKNAVQLNVEEKKTKDRSFGGGRPSGDSNGGSRPRDNGQRRGPGGPGLNRGGGGGGGGGGIGGGGIPGGPGSRPNSFNRGGPPNRGPNNTYNNRR